MPWDPVTTATGGFTLPKHIYIPHASLQVISSGHIPNPAMGGTSIAMTSHDLAVARPIPGAMGDGVHGIRSVQYKARPGI